MATEDVSAPRLLMFMVAAGFGISAAVLVGKRFGYWQAVLAFFAVGLLYPILGALIVDVCKELRRWAFPGITAWDSDTTAGWGAFWPLSIVFWLTIAPFFAIINRLFK
jgi:hypothetical protein